MYHLNPKMGRWCWSCGLKQAMLCVHCNIARVNVKTKPSHWMPDGCLLVIDERPA